MSLPNIWSREARYIALIAVFAFVIGLILYFSELIGPLLLAALLAYVMHPGVEFLSSKTRLSRRASGNIVYILSLLLIAAIPAILTPILVKQIKVLELDLESIVANYSEFISTPYVFLGWIFYPSQFLPDLPQISNDIVPPLAENVLRFIGTATVNSVWILVILVSTYYFLIDWPRIAHWFINLSPNKYRSDVERLSHDIAQVWSDYLRTQLAFMFVVGVVDSLVWLAIGLPGAILLGFLTGLTSFVHEIGAIVSGVLSVLIAFVEGSSLIQVSNLLFALIVFVLYLILTAIKNIWIRPIIVGRGVHLHSGVVFVIVIGALLFHGALAAFIAVPVLVSSMVLIRYLRRRIFGLPPFPESLPAPEGNEK